MAALYHERRARVVNAVEGAEVILSGPSPVARGEELRHDRPATVAGTVSSVAHRGVHVPGNVDSSRGSDYGTAKAEPKQKAESLCLMSFRTLVGWYSSLISVAMIQYFDKK